MGKLNFCSLFNTHPFSIWSRCGRLVTYCLSHLIQQWRKSWHLRFAVVDDGKQLKIVFRRDCYCIMCKSIPDVIQRSNLSAGGSCVSPQQVICISCYGIQIFPGRQRVTFEYSLSSDSVCLSCLFSFGGLQDSKNVTAASFIIFSKIVFFSFFSVSYCLCVSALPLCSKHLQLHVNY